MENKAWVLRTCNADGTSYNGFKWPSKIGSIVKCDDWKPTKECGNGLHGLLDGFGDFDLLSDDPKAIWQIVEIDRDKCIELAGKVKFEECKLIYSGDMAGALTLYIDYRMKLMKHKGEVVDESNARLSSSGDYSKLTSSGYNSQLASSGHNSHISSSGNNSHISSSGYDSKLASSGFYSQLAASGRNSQLAASGNNSQLAASGDHSNLAASGYNSQLTSSGVHSRLTASGESSIAMCAGLGSIASAGENGCIVLTWWNVEKKRYEAEVAHIGENGLKPNTYYELDKNHKFVEA